MHETDRNSSGKGQLLYNGIRLPSTWPPCDGEQWRGKPMPVPYLADPPKVIPIDVGRQLFVDDFLIEDTDLTRTFHRPVIDKRSPVLKPETDLEIENVAGEQDAAACLRDMGLVDEIGTSEGGQPLMPRRPVAAPFGGGVWFDPEDQLFKMWYMAGWMKTIAYATSTNGIHWERPTLDVVEGTNAVLEDMGHTDNTLVWLDQSATEADERFKMFAYHKGPRRRMEVRTSADGVHWQKQKVVYYKYHPLGDPAQLHYSSLDGVNWSSDAVISRLDDCTTFFYNPFRDVWVYSIRSGNIVAHRARHYREHSGFVDGAIWTDDDIVFWTGADELDEPDPEIGHPTQLYNLDAVAYESVMLGLFAVFRGPDNQTAFEQGVPKVNELSVGFSRDGFHWDRPDRRPFIAGSRQPGAWNRAYVRSAGGCCLVVDDELRFYFSTFSGVSPDGRGDPYAGGSTGLAVLRRDGFASMDATEGRRTLTTRPVTFKGRYLFVNANAASGSLEVELLDRSGNVIEPFTRAGCKPITMDSTTQDVTWSAGSDLSAFAGEPVRFRFHVSGGSLYAFWVSPDASGASQGYVAAGGPGFAGARDMPD